MFNFAVLLLNVLGLVYGILKAFVLSLKTKQRLSYILKNHETKFY